MSDGLYLLSWVGFFAVNALMIYAAWWALFSDRDRKTRRCPRCWHNLSHTPGMTCGECGYTAQTEKQLHRRRRQPVLALGAIIVSVLSVAMVFQRLGPNGLASTLPTRGLILLLPFSDGARGEITRELDWRLNRGAVTDGQWEAVVDRWVAGDWGAPPPSPKWQSKYGSRIDNWQNLLQKNPSLKNKLLALPPDLLLTTRATWPVGTPIRVDVDARHWWPGKAELRITATPRLDGVHESYSFRKSGEVPGRPFSMTVPAPPFSMPVPALPPGVHEITWDLAVDRRLPDETQWTHVADLTRSLTIRVRGELASLMEPAQGEDLDAAMRAVFSSGWVRWTSGISPVRVNVLQRQTHIPAFDEVAIGARVELFCDGELARQLDLWWLGGTGLVDRGGQERVIENLDLLTKAGIEGEWTMRVTGMPELALRAGETKRYWAGSIELPVVLRVDEKASPDVPWELEAVIDDKPKL